MSGVAYHRGHSAQDCSTPREFIQAVERRFEPILWDLAAHDGNHVCNAWFGPGSTLENSLTVEWRKLSLFRKLLWLNPPFADIEPWAHKCSIEAHYGARIAFLVPAAVGSNWYRRHVHGQALVLFLSPRLSFDSKNPYPKDCLLALYGEPVGFECWRWR